MAFLVWYKISGVQCTLFSLSSVIKQITVFYFIDFECLRVIRRSTNLFLVLPVQLTKESRHKFFLGQLRFLGNLILKVIHLKS